jgi:hypothetical protein
VKSKDQQPNSLISIQFWQQHLQLSIKRSTTQFPNFHLIWQQHLQLSINISTTQFPNFHLIWQQHLQLSINISKYQQPNSPISIPISQSQLIVTYNGSLTPFIAGSNHLNKQPTKNGKNVSLSFAQNGTHSSQ